jgi:hypothetical protein
MTERVYRSDEAARAASYRRLCSFRGWCAASLGGFERCPFSVRIGPAPGRTTGLQSVVTKTVLPAPPSVNPLGSALMGSCRHSLDDVQRSQVQILPPLRNFRLGSLGEPSLKAFELDSVITKSSLIRSRGRDRAWDVHGRLGATRNVLPTYGA